MNFNLSPELFVGNDPDSKHNAYAVVDRDGNVVDCWTISSKTSNEYEQVQEHLYSRVRPSLDRPFYAVIEGQQVYKDDDKSNPASQIKLARASGISSFYLASHDECQGIHIALPREWKQQKKKAPHQMQIWKSIGEEPTLRAKNSYACPDKFMGMGPSKLKHVGDAIGLALWLRDQYLWNEKKNQFKAN